MGKKPNMRDVAGEESNPGKRGNPGIVTGGVGGAIKGDSSESGSNSYAKSNQATIKKLKGVKLTPISDRDIEIVTDTKIIKN